MVAARPTSWRGLQPGGENDLAGILSRVFAHAVERTGTHPQDGPAKVVRVPLHLRGEEALGRALGPQELIGVAEVSAGLRDRPPGVVIELLVLVTGHDMPGPEGLDLIDRVPPGPEASGGHALSEVHVNPVVDRIPGDDQPEIW